jgi:hypothetical protein
VLDGNTLQNKPELFFTESCAEPQFPEEYEPFEVCFNIKNNGNVAIGEFTVRMITSSKENELLGVDIEDQQVSLLKHGETGEVTLKFEYGMPAGRYVIDSYLDYHKQVPEKNGNFHTSYDLEIG